MECKLMVLSPYEEFGDIVKERFYGFSNNTQIINGRDLDSRLISELNYLVDNNKNPEIIIGRGASLTYASKMFLQSSIIRIEPNFVDILSALNEVCKSGDKVGIITYPSNEIEKNLHILKNIFNLKDIRTYLFRNETDIREQVLNAKNDGMDLVIGGGTLGLEVALYNNISTTLVKSGRASILDAIKDVKIIEASNQLQKNFLNDITYLANLIDVGLLVTAKNSILLTNDQSSNLFYSSAHKHNSSDINSLNKSVVNFVKDENLNKAIIDINNQEYLAKKLTTKVNFIDNIIIFYNKTKLQNINTNIKKDTDIRNPTARYEFTSIIGNDASMKKLIEKATIFAETNAPILITGETGTGKELFAHSIHNHSTRKHSPFIAINCGAIPEQLLESELFGYVEGSFSGARKGGKTGLFELAHKGTIFLDEIDSLPIIFQNKLLRITQDGVLRKLGSEIEIIVDVRILSATNKNIDSLIKKNKLQLDLLNRINTLSIHIPSLKDRISDIELLTNHFISIYCKKYNKVIPSLEKEKIDILKNYDWPGNIRELENAIHRYVVLKNTNLEMNFNECIITNYDNVSSQGISNDKIIINKGTLKDMERAVIISFLNQNKSNKVEVAEQLGISRSTLWRKLNNT